MAIIERIRSTPRRKSDNEIFTRLITFYYDAVTRCSIVEALFLLLLVKL